MPALYYSADAKVLRPSRREMNRFAVRIWLGLTALMVVALVIVGGATRLTESGLSITEWKPIHGIIPPLSQAEWQEEFDLYRQIPQYTQLNRGMTLDEFRTIFWWEWSHRVLARAVGIVFALPLAFFWLTGRLESFLKPRLLAILALGGLQGAIGWWMVASGLTVRVDVSQYRLAVHLVTACVILSGLVWLARGLAPQPIEAPPSRGSAAAALAVVALVFVQIYLGGIVAGLNAGLIYNTWPQMEGALIPAGLWSTVPAWRAAFEDPLTAQFLHRCGAYVVVAAAVLHCIAAFAQAPETSHARRSAVLLALVLVQAAVGVATLLLVVPVGWGVAHQAGAVAVLVYAVAHARSMKGEYSPDGRTLHAPRA